MKRILTLVFLALAATVAAGPLTPATATPVASWLAVTPASAWLQEEGEEARLDEGNCEIDTLGRMETFAGQIGNMRLRYLDLIKHNGLWSKVVPV